jgi:hypothetical protein
MTEIEGKTLIEAWQRLEEVLMQADKDHAMRADGGRAAALLQLGGVSQFISSIAPNRPLLQIPLLALQLALHYLDHGIVEPMVAPNASGRGRRLQQYLIKIRSAVAMSQLHEIGYSRPEAAKRVANELVKVGFKATPGAVADWRDAFKGLPPADETGGIYRTMLANEHQFLGRGSEMGPVQDEKLRSRLHRRILETLRSFILLARLTSTRKLYKIVPKLKFGPPQAS